MTDHADALRRAVDDWSADGTGPAGRAAADDGAARVLAAVVAAEAERDAPLLAALAERDAADSALLAAVADADALSPDLLETLAAAEAAPVCDGTDWSDSAPGGEHP